MISGDPRWAEVSRSEYAHEREGLAYLKEHLPDAPPYRAWTNFEFMDGQGRWHEVDALILGRDRLHLVELKHYSGTLAGNETLWLRNGTRQERSPLLLARRKAQRLASRIESELRKWAHENNHPVEQVTGWLPFTQEAVFLHGTHLKVDMVGVARSNLFGFPGAQNDLPDVMDRLLEPAGSRPVRDVDGKLLAVALSRLGIVRRTTREAGSWLINGSPVEEGEGWQDWPAEHRHNADDLVRIRVFPSPANSPQSARTAIRRRVTREFQLLQSLRHDGIVIPRDYVETDEGDPGLVYRVDDRHTPLDLLVGQSLTNSQRLLILERTADALAYAHRHRVAHRGLSPHSILVSPPTGAPSGATDIAVQLTDWSSAGRIHQSGTGSVSVLADTSGGSLDGVELYEAPEGRLAAADRPSLDMFSLGAVAYYLMTGETPAASRTELREKLSAAHGLDLAGAAGIPYPDERLRRLILKATTPKVSERLGSAQEFADEVRSIRLPPTPADDDVDPLDAPLGTVIQGRFQLCKVLGTGSTATGLLVRDNEADDEERVLKVALNAEAEVRLAHEAEVLTALGAVLPEKSGVVRLLSGPDPLSLPHGRRALLLSSGGEATLGDLTKFDALSAVKLESLGGQLLDTMVELEHAGVLHRDIKPANLALMNLPGGRTRLTLFDFSLARGRVSAVGAGTPPYLDPFLGTRQRPSYDSAAEWYAAAVVLFEMAAWTTPTYGDDASDPAMLPDDVTVEPGFFPGALGRPALADAMTDFFRRALSRNVDQRFDTVEDMRAAWREVFAVTGRRSKPARPVPDPQPLTLSGLVRDLARAAGSSGSNARRLMYLLLPTNPTADDLDPWATQSVFAAALGVTPARVAQLLDDASKKWTAVPDVAAVLDALTTTLWSELTSSGGVSTPDALTTALLSEHFPAADSNGEVSPSDQAATQRTAAGLVRLLVERSTRTDRRLERRRYQGQVVTIGASPLHLDVADAVATRAVRELKLQNALDQHLIPGAVALPGLREEVAALLGDTTVYGDGTPIPDQMVLRLAAIHPDAACLSAAAELHTPDLPIDVAVSTVLQGLPAQATVRPTDIASTVRARFPMLAAGVPHRPALDDVVRRARPDLAWRPDLGAYTGAADSARTSILPSTHGTTHTGPARTPVGPLAVARLADGPVFRAFQVPEGRSDQLAHALVTLLDAEWIDVTSELLRVMRYRAEQAQVPWSTIVAADAGPAQDRQGLASFVEQALPDLIDTIERNQHRPVLLTDLSTLAAYGLLGRLRRWTDLTRPPVRTVLALVPRGSQPGPVVDGTSLPLNSPDQFVPLSGRDVDSIVTAARDAEATRTAAGTDAFGPYGRRDAAGSDRHAEGVRAGGMS